MSPEPLPVASPDLVSPNPLVVIPMDGDTLKRWQSELQRSEKRLARVSPAWDRNMKAYAPDPTDEGWGTEVNPAVDFYQVEQKKALLFFDTPEIILEPDPGSPVDPKALHAQQTLINRRLGLDGLNAKRLVDQVLFDVLCPAGMGCTKIGHTRIIQQIPVPYPQGHPQAGQPQVDATGQPILAPVPLFEESFWERFSPKKLRVSTNWFSTDFDKAPWLGEKFTIPLAVAQQTYQLPDDFSPVTKKDLDLLKTPGLDQDDSDDAQVTGTEIWYKASLYDPAVKHPQIIRQLVLVDGLDQPAVHRNSPYQTIGDDGQLTPNSLIGFPIHVCTIRDLADATFVPSDCTVTRPLVNELSRFRTQLVEHRDASTSIRLADQNVITSDVMAKVIRGPWGTIIPIPNLDPGRPPIVEITHPVYSRENFTAQDKIEQDLTKVNTLSANQVGTEQDTVRSATELTYVQRNADVRMQAERNRVIAWFLGGVRKLDALLQRFPPNGQQPTAMLGRYSYGIKPDSGKHLDAAADRKFFTDTYNLLAPDPNINRPALLTALLPLVRLDPTEVLRQPPPPGPEPPKISFIIKGDDLNPLSPQYPNVQQALALAGVKLDATPITPGLVQNAALAQPMKPAVPQPPHPGSPPRADRVDQHPAPPTGQPPHLGGLVPAPGGLH